MYSNYLIVEILSYINKNLFKKISIKELENHFTYNRDYIMRLFKREIGITIVEYINIKRVYYSLGLVASCDYSLLKISILSGFYSQEYYSEIFKKYIGFSPSIYRKFIFRDISISSDVNNEINKNIDIIKQKLIVVDKYMSNLEPVNKTRILSIFK